MSLLPTGSTQQQDRNASSVEDNTLENATLEPAAAEKPSGKVVPEIWKKYRDRRLLQWSIWDLAQFGFLGFVGAGLMVTGQVIVGLIILALGLIPVLLELARRGNLKSLLSEMKSLPYVSERRVPKRIGLLRPGMEYRGGRGLKKARFYQAGMMDFAPDYSAWHNVTGLIGQTKVEVSQIRFDGRDWLVMVAEGSRSINGTTHVVPSSRLFQWKRPRRHKLSYVEMDMPEFVSRFKVYSSDPVAAHLILSSSMMRRICDVQNRWRGTNLRITFSGRFTTVAIQTYFAPGFLPAEMAPNGEKMIDETRLKAAMELVDDLDLNSEIWPDDSMS